MAIPIGGGLKIAVNENFNVIMEYGIRKTFTDYIDDVSTTYVEASILSELGASLADPSINKFAAGFQRGDKNNKDKYGFFGITVLYSIKDPKKDCHNIVY